MEVSINKDIKIMKAVQIAAPSDMKVEEVEKPVLHAGEVLV